MMADEDDDDIWYGKAKNGLIQTQTGTSKGLEDSYLQESKDALSSALGPRWNSKVLEENADRTTKAFLNGISSPKALGSLHAMMGAMGALLRCPANAEWALMCFAPRGSDTIPK